MRTYSYENLDHHIKPGVVYRRKMLASFFKALDRDLDILIKKMIYKNYPGDFIISPLFLRLDCCHLKIMI